MDSLLQLVVGFLMLLFLCIPLAFLWKYRLIIKRWINDINYGDIRTWEANKTTRAERELIKANWKVQDAQGYLVYLKEQEAKEKETETGG